MTKQREHPYQSGVSNPMEVSQQLDCQRFLHPIMPAIGNENNPLFAIILTVHLC